jgi:hypothetical protein
MNKKIDIEKIKAVKVIVTHDNCTDGLAAAILLHDVLPDAEIIFAQHGTEAYAKLEVRPNMLFVDIVPPKERYEEFLKAGAIVLDHHKGVKDVVEKFGTNAVFGDEKLDPGVSGGPLAYKHVWKPLHALSIEQEKKEDPDFFEYHSGNEAFEKFVARFAERAGIRDTWQRHNPEWYEATLQGEVLYFWPREFWLDIRLADIARLWEEKFHPVGSILMKKHAASVQWTLDEAYNFTSKRGTRVVCFNSPRMSSDVAELLDKDADLIVGFKYKCDLNDDDSRSPKLIFSTRSHTFYDCMSFTKWYGGGGHTKAAGFNKDVLKEDVNAYTYIQNLVDVYEEEHPHAARLRPCGTCGKLGHLPQEHAGWDPTQEGHG